MPIGRRGGRPWGERARRAVAILHPWQYRHDGKHHTDPNGRSGGGGLGQAGPGKTLTVKEVTFLRV